METRGLLCMCIAMLICVLIDVGEGIHQNDRDHRNREIILNNLRRGLEEARARYQAASVADNLATQEYFNDQPVFLDDEPVDFDDEPGNFDDELGPSLFQEFYNAYSDVFRAWKHHRENEEGYEAATDALELAERDFHGLGPQFPSGEEHHYQLLNAHLHAREEKEDAEKALSGAEENFLQEARRFNADYNIRRPNYRMK